MLHFLVITQQVHIAGKSITLNCEGVEPDCASHLNRHPALVELYQI